MTKEERLAWEKEQGFKSFGTICDEFYETIDPESFKSSEEVKAFVAKHSDKIGLFKNSSNETYCEPLSHDNLFKNIINKDGMFIVGEKVNKVIDNVLISTSLSNYEILKNNNDITSFSNKKLFDTKKTSRNISYITSTIENTAFKEEERIAKQSYKIKLYLRTTSFRDKADPRNQQNLLNFYGYRITEYRVINYSRWMWIWWVDKFNSKLSGTITTNDSYNVKQSLTIPTFNGSCDDSEYRRICDDIYSFIDPNNNSTSYFVNYDITATNLEKELSVNLKK